MSTNTLPTISKQEIDAAANDAAHELIYLLTSRYRALMATDNGIAEHFTMEQNVLMAFEVFDGQVCNGGFLQLIENGYGSFVFHTALGDHLREWGANETAVLIDQARPMYEAKKEILEREKTLQEFSKMYQEHTEFEPLDNEFYKVADAEREAVKAYIMGHLDKFAITT